MSNPFVKTVGNAVKGPSDIFQGKPTSLTTKLIWAVIIVILIIVIYRMYFKEGLQLNPAMGTWDSTYQQPRTLPLAPIVTTGTLWVPPNQYIPATYSE